MQAPRYQHCFTTCEFHQRSDHIYAGQDFGPIWQCPNCVQSICGCHRGTGKPLGNPANAATRKARRAAHNAFDPIWRKRGKAWTRPHAYRALAECMGISPAKCHISWMDQHAAERVVQLCRNGRVQNVLKRLLTRPKTEDSSYGPEKFHRATA